jgi:predicted RNase H-like nuclease
VRFLGVDLAWGQRAWTGLAVLDADGTLLDLARARTDEEVLAWLRPHSRGPVVLGVDAPLVVPNLTGRRHCETLVSRVFGRYAAGAHSSNRSLPAFRDGPRAGRLAAALDLSADPLFSPRTPVRRALEVYPHPATVTLFGLDRVLPYKAKQGRTPASRRVAMLELVDRTAALAAAEPALRVDRCAGWARARAAVAAATRHLHLEQEEDALDAVLCGYVALHRWTHGDDRSAVLGDADTGYVVVPLDDRARRRLAELEGGAVG